MMPRTQTDQPRPRRAALIAVWTLAVALMACTAGFGLMSSTAASGGLASSLPREEPMIRVRTNSGVVEIPMERYVAGVISAELYADWSPAAYEAQAIATRSYALHQMRRARDDGRDYDVESTTADQVFRGATERTVAIEAAEATRGLVVVHLEAGRYLKKADVVRAYFSSSCGGRPASAGGDGGIWPSAGDYDFNAVEPLRGAVHDCPCSFSSLDRWDRNRTESDLRRSLIAWGERHGRGIANLGRLVSIEPAARNATGRPGAYVVTDAEGETYELLADDLRVACNAGHANSRPLKQRVISNDLSFSFDGSRVTIAGRGFGHGVGLCQHGAEGYARAGVSSREMLARFYPGSEVRRLWR